MNIARTPQNHDVETGDLHKHDCPRSATSIWKLSNWCYSTQVWTFPLAVLTLGAPSFHESLASKESHLGLPDAIAVWKTTRSFASILVGILIATLLSPMVQPGVIVLFLVSSSLLQAILGLTCSNILIICFSSHSRHNHDRDPTELNFLFWSVWDLFSVPFIWTAWSAITSSIALIIVVICPGTAQCGPSQGQTIYSSAARIALSLLICISGILFIHFLLHLRHLSRMFSKTTHLNDP